MGCQKKIAQKIVEQGGEYLLALKGNQSILADEVEEASIDADATLETAVGRPSGKRCVLYCPALYTRP